MMSNLEGLLERLKGKDPMDLVTGSFPDLETMWKVLRERARLYLKLHQGEFGEHVSKLTRIAKILGTELGIRIDEVDLRPELVPLVLDIMRAFVVLTEVEMAEKKDAWLAVLALSDILSRAQDRDGGVA